MSPLPRLLLLHKQGTSGRVRFLCLASGVVAFAPLPALSALRDEDYSPTLQVHPTAVMREAEIHLGLGRYAGRRRAGAARRVHRHRPTLRHGRAPAGPFHRPHRSAPVERGRAQPAASRLRTRARLIVSDAAPSTAMLAGCRSSKLCFISSGLNNVGIFYRTSIRAEDWYSSNCFV